MCARITLLVTPMELREIFDVVRGWERIIDWSLRYNVAPMTQMICIRQSAGEREVFPAKWGLIPSWAKDPKLATSAINAKSETLESKPMFRAAFRSSRCVVVASGFYEWESIGAKQKQPHYITLRSGEPMGFAGLWESWQAASGDLVETCTICTVPANSLMTRFNDRMPVILPDGLMGPWLDPSLTECEQLKPILGQYPASEMQEWSVDRSVGNVRSQGKHLIDRVAAQKDLFA